MKHDATQKKENMQQHKKWNIPFSRNVFRRTAERDDKTD